MSIMSASMRIVGNRTIYEVECDCEAKHKWTLAPDFSPTPERFCLCGRTLMLDIVTSRVFITPAPREPAPLVVSLN